MYPQHIQDYIEANAQVAGPASDVEGTLWRYSATFKGHQAMSNFLADPELAKKQAMAILLDALEAHGVDFPELAPPEELLPEKDAPTFEFEGSLPDEPDPSA